MRFVWQLVGLIAKAAVVIAGVVIAMEAVDRVRDREQSRYLVDEDFDD